MVTPEVHEMERVTCPACNGPTAFIGQLGAREHFRCNDCGLDSSRRMPESDLEALLDMRHDDLRGDLEVYDDDE